MLWRRPMVRDFDDVAIVDLCTIPDTQNNPLSRDEVVHAAAVLVDVTDLLLALPVPCDRQGPLHPCRA
eukprot:scaffold13825_cov73-Skeletonema_marinoi.AAC.1